MNARIRSLGFTALICALAAAAAGAETDPSAVASADLPGLLGRTYLGLDAGAFRLRNTTNQSKPTGAAGDMELSLPITDGFDYHLNVGYDKVSRAGVLVRDAQADNSVIYYYRSKWIAPFASAGFGYDAAREIDPATTREIKHYFLLDAGAGLEVPLAKTSAIRVGLNYDFGFARPSLHRVEYDVMANHWFNDTVGTRLGATMRKGSGGAHDAITYIAGVQFSFD